MRHVVELLRAARLLPAALCLVAGLASPRVFAAEPLGIASVSRPTEWTVSYQGKPVLVYASDPQQFKPYVRGLYTVKGYGVLRDAPSDHLHHHALMYGIRVNGLNFWEETPGCGVQKVVETSSPELRTTAAGLHEARLVQVIYWLAPADAFVPNTNAAPLLIERRTLKLVINPVKEETALHWNSHFEVGPRTNEVTLTGANYHGLGMRFRQELDPLAVHVTAEGRPDLSNNRQDVSRHSWQAVVFDAPQRPATIAIFGDPANAQGMPRFFAMKTPFAYLSATQGLDTEPLVYRRGETFELDFLITLHPEIKAAEALSQIGREWRQAR